MEELELEAKIEYISNSSLLKLREGYEKSIVSSTVNPRVFYVAVEISGGGHLVVYVPPFTEDKPKVHITIIRELELDAYLQKVPTVFYTEFLLKSRSAYYFEVLLCIVNNILSGVISSKQGLSSSQIVLGIPEDTALTLRKVAPKLFSSIRFAELSNGAVTHTYRSKFYTTSLTDSRDTTLNLRMVGSNNGNVIRVDENTDYADERLVSFAPEGQISIDSKLNLSEQAEGSLVDFANLESFLWHLYKDVNFSVHFSNR